MPDPTQYDGAIAYLKQTTAALRAQVNGLLDDLVAAEKELSKFMVAKGQDHEAVRKSDPCN